jgi:hypothetical protein
MLFANKKIKDKVMKLSRILPLVVGGAVAGIVVSGASPAQALTWNWSYTGTGISASGTFTTNDTPDGSGFYTISGISGTRNGVTISALSAPGLLGLNDNRISASSPYLTLFGFTYSWNGSFVNVDNVLGIWTEGRSPLNFGTNFGLGAATVNFTASPSTPVPFDTPAGQAMATVGSLFVLGLMRQAKKRLAAKKLVINPVETVV